MAFLRKWIDKQTFILISSGWVALSSYLLSQIKDPPLATLIITIGSLVITWIGVESQSTEPKQA